MQALIDEIHATNAAQLGFPLGEHRSYASLHSMLLFTV